MGARASEGQAASIRALLALAEQLNEALEHDDRLEASDVLARVKSMHRLRVTIGRIEGRTAIALNEAIENAAAGVAIRTAEAVEREDQTQVDILTRAGATLRWCRNGPARDASGR